MHQPSWRRLAVESQVEFRAARELSCYSWRLGSVPEPTRNCAMSHSERSQHHRSIDVRIKDDAAKKAQQHANKLACETCNERLALLGGPLQPSPSLRAAINGGFSWLRVECNACYQNPWVDLKKVRRTGQTSIWALEASLCEVCRRRRSIPPRAKIERLYQYDKQIGPAPYQNGTDVWALQALGLMDHYALHR
jgi:hypothetical protein